jgi:hypothetical protein
LFFKVHTYGLSGWARLNFSSSVTIVSTLEVEGHRRSRICLRLKVSSSLLDILLSESLSSTRNTFFCISFLSLIVDFEVADDLYQSPSFPVYSMTGSNCIKMLVRARKLKRSYFENVPLTFGMITCWPSQTGMAGKTHNDLHGAVQALHAYKF